MKKNQIIFVVILAAVVMLATLLITIFAIFRIDSFQIESTIYDNDLMATKIVSKLEERLQAQYSKKSSLFFGKKEVERTLQALEDSNKNYLVIEKVEKRSAKTMHITIGQRRIDNYCYRKEGKYYHINSYGEVLQVTDNQQNSLTKENNLLLNNALTLSGSVQTNLTGQALYDSLKIILQKLDDYFERDKLVRTNLYLKGATVKEVAQPNSNAYINFSFTVENDWHYTQDGNYEIYFVSVAENTKERAALMYNKLSEKGKEAAHNRLDITGLNLSWTTHTATP